MAAGRGDLQGAPGASLATYIGQVRQVIDHGPDHWLRSRQLTLPGQGRGDPGQVRSEPAVGVPDQPGLARVLGRQHQATPGLTRMQDRRKAAGHTAQLSGQRQFAKEFVIIQITHPDLFRGDQNAECDRQVEATAVLRQVGRCQRHRDPPLRLGKAGIADRRTHPVTRFAHCRVGQADDIEARQTAGQVHFGPHRGCGNAKLGTGMNDCQVHRIDPLACIRHPVSVRAANPAIGKPVRSI